MKNNLLCSVPFNHTIEYGQVFMYNVENNIPFNLPAFCVVKNHQMANWNMGGQLVNGKNNIQKKKSPKVEAYDNDVMVLRLLSNVWNSIITPSPLIWEFFTP